MPVMMVRPRLGNSTPQWGQFMRAGFITVE
jgi:hypothetical protein